MELAGDIMLHDDVSAEALRRGAASGFGVSITRVAIRELGTSWPADADVVIQLWENLPGDWPSMYNLYVTDEQFDNIQKHLAAFAHALGVPILTGAPVEDPFIYELYLADGSSHEVEFFQNEDDGGFYDTPEVRDLIAQSTPPIALAS